jgi:hypothetical protein
VGGMGEEEERGMFGALEGSIGDGEGGVGARCGADFLGYLRDGNKTWGLVGVMGGVEIRRPAQIPPRNDPVALRQPCLTKSNTQIRGSTATVA